jgi:hypothetical protein
MQRKRELIHSIIMSNPFGLSFRRGNSILFGIVIIAASSRGVFEALLERSIAYLIQLAFICVPIFIIEYRSRRIDSKHRLITKFGPSGEFGWVILLSVASVFVTATLEGALGIQYLFVLMFTWLLLAFATQQNRSPTLDYRYCFWISTISASILGLVGLLQQLLIFPFELPGYTNLFDVIRPPSLTGSYLHYPLIIAIAACNCYVAVLAGMRLAMIPMIFLAILTFASFSRSGMLILFASFGLSMLFKRRYFVRSCGIIAGIFICIIIMGEQVDTGALSILDRVTSSVDIGSTGNDVRYGFWLTALDMLSPLNIFVGTYFGLVTNSAPDNIRAIYGIVESSPLQQILNIGFVGTIIYYHTFYRLIRGFPRRDHFSKFILAAAALQSLFYQSIEVIPFLVMIINTAILSSSLQNEVSR